VSDWSVPECSSGVVQQEGPASPPSDCCESVESGYKQSRTEVAGFEGCETVLTGRSPLLRLPRVYIVYRYIINGIQKLKLAFSMHTDLTLDWFSKGLPISRVRDSI
jgi:hypothetical protein